MKSIGQTKLIIFVAVFWLLLANGRFFGQVLAVYPVNLSNSVFLLSLFIVFSCVNVLLLALLCWRYTAKPVLMVLLLVTSATAYFMDSYHIIIDDVMLDNIIKTDTAESLDLLSLKLFFYLTFLWLLPALWVYRVAIVQPPFRTALWEKLQLMAGALALAVGLIVLLGQFYAPFFREHKPLRFYSNPSYYLYSLGKYLSQSTKQNLPLKSIGLDAKISSTDAYRELIIFVVGETARADHFALNGYPRPTNPLLSQQQVISFSNVWACGTSTAVSVPCLFSIYGRDDYDPEQAHATENVLDILQRVGVNVLWLDNNSDSKGVAERVPYESYKTPDKNPMCDSECRDVGMLSHLQAYINAHPKGDIFIVLHQMGNHGPAYFKRYPPQFEKFTPTCQTNQLEQCTPEQINNSFDNAILYTDYFLNKTIELLKKNSQQFEAILFYISDHGESLGENGLYLHGLPYFIAPDAQKQVPLILWFSDSFDNYHENHVLGLKQKSQQLYSHDHVFHTVLGLLEIKTDVYDPKQDIIRASVDAEK